MLLAGKVISTTSDGCPVSLPELTVKSWGTLKLKFVSNPRKLIPVPLALNNPPEPRSALENVRPGFRSVGSAEEGVEVCLWSRLWNWVCFCMAECQAMLVVLWDIVRCVVRRVREMLHGE